ncbi:glycosyltransferase [Candidatus Uhrbacteria bacterium]|nr:glycosyltransferase [Candidatus Uhrbacteria bacterium]
MNELSIVVPCVTTTESLPKFLDDLASFLMANPSDTDCIVVTNDAPDVCAAVMQYVEERYPWLQFTVLRRVGDARGYGALARFGIAHSTSRYVALVSPYGEDDLSVLPKLLAVIRGGAQVVQVTRFANPEDARVLPMKFRFYQAVYRALVRVLLGHHVTDSTYGYKCFDRAFMQALGLTQNGYSICPEITLKGLLVGGKVAYVPSRPQVNRANQDFSLLREGPGYVWLLLRGAGHRAGISWF